MEREARGSLWRERREALCGERGGRLSVEREARGSLWRERREALCGERGERLSVEREARGSLWVYKEARGSLAAPQA